MRHLAPLAFLLPCFALAADASPPRFLSWYDGWGTHTVWGIGKVQGSYVGTVVLCGKEAIPVAAIYDTHADHTEPRNDQGADFARRANRQLLERFRAAKVSCTFVVTGPDEA
jgi:hypothetical protein